MPRRHDANSPGAWYTTGRCLACSVPEDAAPMLFAPLGGENWLTHFVRQPSTEAEVERVCHAAIGCCVADVRYGGCDRAIIRRLGNHPEYCDYVVDSEGELLEALDRHGHVRAEFHVELRRRIGPNRFHATVARRVVTWWLPWVAFDAPLEVRASTVERPP
jgi:hypothetical protein